VETGYARTVTGTKNLVFRFSARDSTFPVLYLSRSRPLCGELTDEGGFELFTFSQEKGKTL
jgi:hypothetical protein